MARVMLEPPSGWTRQIRKNLKAKIRKRIFQAFEHIHDFNLIQEMASPFFHLRQGSLRAQPIDLAGNQLPGDLVFLGPWFQLAAFISI